VWWPLRGSFVPGFDLRREAHSVRGTVWEREGLKETRPLWPPQRGVGLQEPNLGKTNPCVSLHYSLAICFAHSLADSFIFLTLTRLVVVFIFVNFSFALFTPPLGDFQARRGQGGAAACGRVVETMGFGPLISCLTAMIRCRVEVEWTVDSLLCGADSIWDVASRGSALALGSRSGGSDRASTT
jgi:hypothetical protein